VRHGYSRKCLQRKEKRNKSYRITRLVVTMTRLQSILIISLAVTAINSYAATEAVYPLVTYKCNPDADTITITNSLLKNDEGASYHYSDEDGTYSPWDLVDIDRKTDLTRIVKTRSIVKKCTLSSGEYTIRIDPQVFSRTLSGTCGASISSAFSVEFNDTEIKERTPFEDFCRGNAPVITRVTVFGKTSEVKIKRIPRYRFY
jgi:hypothetical protein